MGDIPNGSDGRVAAVPDKPQITRSLGCEGAASAEAIWASFLLEAASSDRVEKFWIDCLRRTYPDLLVPDLAGRFVEPLRALAAKRTPLGELTRELSFSPIDLPGWQELSAAALYALDGADRKSQDVFVLELSARLVESARVAVDSGLSPLDTRQELETGAESVTVLPERWQETAGLVGSSRIIRDLVGRAARAARDRYPVLLVGESGVGKEVVARLIHELSETRGRFVAVNCAAIPETLFESELFGHVRGAFSGALERRDGLFLEAEGGTLLLDEVSEIPLHEQAKILRVLQDGLIRRVGGSQLEKVDFRAIATSNRDLEQMLADGHLRRDLYYRLAVHEIAVPRLREHRADIPELVAVFLDRWRRSNPERPPPTFSPQAMAAMVTRNWPGNVRELEHAVYRLASWHGGENIEAAQVAALEQGAQPENRPTSPRAAAPGRTRLADVERDAVVRALAATNGNKAAAARRLGVTRKTLYRKIRRYGVELA